MVRGPERSAKDNNPPTGPMGSVGRRRLRMLTEWPLFRPLVACFHCGGRVWRGLVRGEKEASEVAVARSVPLHRGDHGRGQNHGDESHADQEVNHEDLQAEPFGPAKRGPVSIVGEKADFRGCFRSPLPEGRADLRRLPPDCAGLRHFGKTLHRLVDFLKAGGSTTAKPG